MGLNNGMMCSERDSTSKVYDKNMKKYIVKKEVTVGVNNGYLGIEPDQLKECISPFIAKYYDIEVTRRTLKAWN